MAFVCQMCGESSDARGDCPACGVARVPAGMVGDPVDAIAEPPDPPVSSWALIGGLAASIAALFLLGPDFSTRMFGETRVGFYLTAVASLLLIAYGERIARRLRKRRADRRLREGLDARTVVEVADARPGIVRVRGRVKLRAPTGPAFPITGTCAHAFSIADDTGSIDVEPGAVMTAWDADPAAHELREGDLVEAVGFVSEGPPRPGRGYRDAATTLEMHGRDGVPLYLRPLAEREGPRVRVEVDLEEEAEADAEAASTRRDPRATPARPLDR